MDNLSNIDIENIQNEISNFLKNMMHDNVDKCKNLKSINESSLLLRNSNYNLLQPLCQFIIASTTFSLLVNNHLTDSMISRLQRTSKNIKKP